MEGELDRKREIIARLDGQMQSEQRKGERSEGNERDKSNWWGNQNSNLISLYHSLTNPTYLLALQLNGTYMNSNLEYNIITACKLTTIIITITTLGSWHFVGKIKTFCVICWCCLDHRVETKVYYMPNVGNPWAHIDLVWACIRCKYLASFFLWILLMKQIMQIVANISSSSSQALIPLGGVIYMTLAL